MGQINAFEPVKILIGVIYHNETIYESAYQMLTIQFGAIDFVSSPLKFQHTHYYEQEMGSALLKRFLTLKNKIPPDTAYRLKTETNQIENTFSVNNKRQINIDPGMITLHNVILLSTKNFSHRIPLSTGIYAETTLIYNKNKKNYLGLPWTYPDFLTPEYQTIFNEIRSRL